MEWREDSDPGKLLRVGYLKCYLYHIWIHQCSNIPGTSDWELFASSTFSSPSIPREVPSISSPPQTNARFNYTHTELLCIGYLSVKFMSVGDQQHGSIWVLKLKSRKTLFVCYTDVRTKSLTHIKLKCNSFVLLWLSPRLPCHARSKEGFRGVNQTDCVTNTRRTVWFVCTPLNVLGHPSIELKGWWGGWWWTTLPNDLHSEFSSGKKRDLLISVRNTCKYPSSVYWWSH